MRPAPFCNLIRDGMRRGEAVRQQNCLGAAIEPHPASSRPYDHGLASRTSAASAAAPPAGGTPE
jgi:hypothetical protein